MNRKIALVTCLSLPEPDPDAEILVQGLLEEGIDSEYVAWDDDTVDWSAYSLAIMRSAWNYHLAEKQFRDWMQRVSESTTLLNSPGLILNNLNKGYLSSLKNVGIPIVPTVFIKPDQFQDPVEVAKERHWSRFVVKPAVSAGSYLTERFRLEDSASAREFLAEVLTHGEAMMQEYLSSVEDGGEVNLVYIAGELTHAITKRPRFSKDDESVSGSFHPSPMQISVGRQVMATLPEPALYARVDLMRKGNDWMLSELELIEPSLFFLQDPPALSRFSQQVKRRL